jgi:acetyl-CoA acyltransferase 2
MRPASSTTDIVFLSGKRTPFGTFNGSLKDFSATQLGLETATAALTQAQVEPGQVEHVVYGNVIQTSADAIYLPRHIGLKSGVPVSAGALAVNRLCGSGFEAFVTAAHLMMAGEAEVVLAGGTESMSQAPFVIRGARSGLGLGKGQLEDTLTQGLFDTYPNIPMGITAENLAEQYHLTQAEVDVFSVLSQTRHAAASRAGHFKLEIQPVEIKSKKGSTFFAHDEHGRPDSTIEGFAKLPKVFKKDGVIHPGAASGINDGAASAVMCTAAWAEKNNKKPMGRLVNWASCGCDPKIMGIGPLRSQRGLCAPIFGRRERIGP